MRWYDFIVLGAVGVVIAISVITISSGPPKDGSEMPNGRVGEDNAFEERALAPASAPVLMDPFGVPISSIEVGEQVLFQSEVTNTQDERQPFVYVLQIRDSEGKVESLSYAKSELPANGALNVAQSWIPAASGIYEVEVFVWDDIEGETILSPARRISVQVFGP